MEFNSPRFAGDLTLETILNDPDKGTVKLQSGSPSDSVSLVQRALWDMWWPEQMEPPVQTTEAKDFVDGLYGQVTSRAVLTYKKHYGLRFPPGDPAGIIDGFAGPRTMALLDRHMTLYNELDAPIQTRFNDMAAAASSPGFGSKRSMPILGTSTLQWRANIDNVNTFFFASPGRGAAIVVDPIATAYLGHFGGPAGQLGAPLDDAHAHDSGITQEFEFGILRHDNASKETQLTATGKSGGATPGF